MSVRDLAPDTIVDERYQILERVGSGGMADVYCAQDLQLGRKIALKLLHRRFADDREFVERFRREASAAASLQHANVVAVFDRGEWDGTYYIAMELLEGASLKQMIQQQAPVEPVAAIDMVLQILRAARFAHRHGVIHRDLKPQNVILDAEGRAKVTDFGIARAGASDMTETGSILGTAQYLSPEQAQGHAVSAASDLYSIAIILYELLTGRLPFDGETAVAIAMKQISEAPVPPSVWNPTIPPELDALVMHAMQKDPAQRFSTADEFIAALEAMRAHLLGEPAGDHTAVFGAVSEDAGDGGYPDDDDAEPRHPWRRWGAALLVLLVLAGAAVAAYALTRPDRVAVPNVVGRQLTTALTMIHNAGLETDVQRVPSATAPVDRVMRQDPQPRSDVDRGATVTLTVSSGPGQATVPPVAGKSRKAAIAALRAQGFDVRVTGRPSSSVDKGGALGTSPAAGERIDKGTQVVLYVSSGPRQVSVPDVVGSDEATARATLTGAGLEAKVTQQDSTTDDPGTVLSQSPGSSSTVPLGSTVELTVAREPRTVAVPNVTGSTGDAATQALSADGFTVVTTQQRTTDPAEDGTVLGQSPAGGKQVPRGSKVRIRVGALPSDGGSPSPPGAGTTPGGGNGGGNDDDGGGGGGGTGGGGTTTTPGTSTTPSGASEQTKPASADSRTSAVRRSRWIEAQPVGTRPEPAAL